VRHSVHLTPLSVLCVVLCGMWSGGWGGRSVYVCACGGGGCGGDGERWGILRVGRNYQRYQFSQ
jgi:hypothetical protein